MEIDYSSIIVVFSNNTNNTCMYFAQGQSISLSMEMSKLKRDGTVEPVSRDQIFRRVRGQGGIHFPCSADHEQDWQPYRLIDTLLYVMTIRSPR